MSAAVIRRSEETLPPCNATAAAGLSEEWSFPPIASGEVKLR